MTAIINGEKICTIDFYNHTEIIITNNISSKYYDKIKQKCSKIGLKTHTKVTYENEYIFYVVSTEHV